MVSYKVLEKFGTTDERLRKFFTAKMPDPRRQRKMTPDELKDITEEVRLREKFKMQTDCDLAMEPKHGQDSKKK